MKKVFILSFFFIAISVSLSAQIKKGSTLFGIDFGFNGSNFKQVYAGNEIKSSSTGFNTSLLYGKAVKENLFAGGGFSYSLSKYKQGNPQTEQTIKNYGASVWARKYFPVFGPFYAFVNGSLYASIGNNENPNSNPGKTNSFGSGYRVYYSIDGDTIVLLLLGGDKNTQKRDIKKDVEFIHVSSLIYLSIKVSVLLLYILISLL